MQLLMIRHGKAGDSEAWIKAGKDDFDRPLTKKGREEFKAAAKELRRQIPQIDLLATSPLVRAAQTAKIVYAAYDDEPQFIELEMLSGDHPGSELVAWLNKHGAGKEVVAIVGHSPDVGNWTSYLLSGKVREDMVKFRKGAAFLFEFPHGIASGKATLAAMYQP
jgi:phosphohistidine phosphatase